MRIIWVHEIYSHTNHPLPANTMSNAEVPKLGVSWFTNGGNERNSPPLFQLCYKLSLEIYCSNYKDGISHEKQKVMTSTTVESFKENSLLYTITQHFTLWPGIRSGTGQGSSSSDVWPRKCQLKFRMYAGYRASVWTMTLKLPLLRVVPQAQTMLLFWIILHHPRMD